MGCLPHAGGWLVAQACPLGSLAHFVLQAPSARTCTAQGQPWLSGPVLAWVVSASPWLRTAQRPQERGSATVHSLSQTYLVVSGTSLAQEPCL